MGKHDYKLIQGITKELQLNNGQGYSLIYIKHVLSPVVDRRNEEIELIAMALSESTKQAKKTIINGFDGLKNQKAFWLKLELKNSAA